VKGDVWFRSVRCAATLGENGKSAVLHKTGHGLFPKKFIEEALSEALGGIHIVLKGNAPNGVPLVALGYHYNAKTMPYFVMMEDTGMMKLGDPYEMKCTDMHKMYMLEWWKTHK